MPPGPCTICEAGEGAQMCRTCAKAYDREAFEEGGVWEAMRWAALRTKRLTEKRLRKTSP